MSEQTTAPFPVSTDLHPDLAKTLNCDTKDCDVWECRMCSNTALFVVVVPYDGAWRHQVDPRCADHYPPAWPRLSSHGWPGPSTPTRAARRKDSEKEAGEQARFSIRWDRSMGCYRVSVPELSMGGERIDVVRLDALRARLAEMELHDDLPDSHDIGYMAAWREITRWLAGESE